MASTQQLDVAGTKEVENVLPALELMEKKGNQHVHELDYVMVNEDANSSRGQVQIASK
jgi:hypothetical protein